MSKYLIVIVIAILYLFTTTGCIGLHVDPSSAAPSQSSETQTPTGTPCPAGGAVEIGAAEVDPTKLIIVLVDKSGSYAQLTATAIQQLQRILPQIATPGDRIIVSWIGSSSGDPTEFFVREDLLLVPTVDLAEPPTMPTTIPLPTLIPTSAQVPQTTMGQMSATKTAAAIAAQNATAPALVATQNAAALSTYRCDRQAWQRASAAMLQGREADRRRIIQEFTDRVIPVLKQAEEIPAFDQSTRISDALLVSSKIFQDAIRLQQYQKYQLLIFSDMQEIAPNGMPDASALDLSSIDVTVAGLSCDLPSDCRKAEQVWSKRFASTQVKSTRFLLVVQTTDDELITILR